MFRNSEQLSIMFKGLFIGAFFWLVSVKRTIFAAVNESIDTIYEEHSFYSHVGIGLNIRGLQRQ